MTNARRTRPNTEMTQQIIDQCLSEIGKCLNDMGSSLRPKNLPEPVDSNFRFRRQLAVSVFFTEEQINQKYSTLNEQQKNVFNEVIQAVREKNGQMFFLNASGGTGNLTF